MSFDAPLFLLGLLILPLLAGAALWARRRPARYLVRLPSAPTLAAVLPKVPRWRRVVPPVLLALALAGIVTALARPQASVAVPVERASVVLVTDASGSMRATDVEPTRLEAARGAATGFTERVPKELRIGVVGFSDAAHTVVPPTTDRETTRTTLDGLVADGGTATGPALQAALDSLRSQTQGGQRPPAAIVLLSDGRPTVGGDPVEIARAARQAGVPIHTVALGTNEGVIETPEGMSIPVPPDPDTLARIAETSGGRSYATADPETLDGIYDQLGSRVGTKTEKREVTAAFAAAGLLLLAGAVATGTRTRPRLP